MVTCEPCTGYGTVKQRDKPPKTKRKFCPKSEGRRPPPPSDAWKETSRVVEPSRTHSRPWHISAVPPTRIEPTHACCRIQGTPHCRDCLYNISNLVSCDPLHNCRVGVVSGRSLMDREGKPQKGPKKNRRRTTTGTNRALDSKRGEETENKGWTVGSVRHQNWWRSDATSETGTKSNYNTDGYRVAARADSYNS